MSKVDLEKSILGWILQNKIKNERGDILEFKDHYFMIEPYSNWNPKLVCMKSAQVGFSTAAILKTIYGAAKRKYNCIYTLPTFDDVRDFVPSKVDGMVENNPALARIIGSSDALTRKEVGNNFIWYRGTHGKKAAIMHTSDLNVYDEYDASNLGVIDLYASRLQYSRYKGEWFFSNPIRPGGIDAKYEMSDKRRWLITCSRCNYKQPLEFEANVCRERKVYKCSKCQQELSREDRRVGEWVAEHPGRDMHGYHINQLMAPWVSAKDLLYLEETKTPEYFHNMVLGLPYIDKDDVVDRSLIEQAITTRENNMLRNAMGVDVGYHELHYVLGNHDGVFKVGKCQGDRMWDDLERIIKKYNPITVIDANPDSYPRRVLLPKYPNKVFACFYKHNLDRTKLIMWGEKDKRGHVYVDRNQLISYLIYRFIEKKIRFTTNGVIPQVYSMDELAEYIKHWENIYKITKEDRNGISYSSWEHAGPDHFVHATGYFEIALTKVHAIMEEDTRRENSALVIVNEAIPADKIPIMQEGSRVDKDSWKYS